MARLRNRILKAEFWTDPELLRWPRDKRWAYQGLWEAAEDSGCLEDDPFGWKLLMWPSPLDADITIELLEQWRDEFVAAGKIIPYTADGKDYLWLKTFHEHEHPRNPQSPNLPLPAWVKYQTREITRKDSGRGGSFTINEYVVDLALIPTTSNATVTVPLPKVIARATPVQSSPVQSSPARKHMSVISDEPESTDPSLFGEKTEKEAKEGAKDEKDGTLPLQKGEARHVFGYWCTRCKKNANTKFDNKRHERVRWALKTYGLDTCLAAIDGYAKDGWAMADPVRHELTLIFRDAAHVEKHLTKPKSVLEMIDEEWGGGAE